MKKQTFKIEQIVIANGRVLIERTTNPNIYKVLKLAKNVNYEGLGKTIEEGDLVLSSEWLYNNNFKIGKKEYFIIKPTAIVGYFDCINEMKL